MRDVYVYRYVLRSRARANRLTGRLEHPGALVRIGTGFACLHPWPELGDLPLDEQLRRLGAGRETALTLRARACALADGAARERGVSLFDGLEIPASHWLWNPGLGADEQIRRVVEFGYGAVKVKCDGSGADRVALEEIASGTPEEVLLRPDLNAALEVESALRWWEGLGPEVRGRVEFLEEPMGYEAETWGRVGLEMGVDFALDRAAGSEVGAGGGYRWRVIKPAVENPEEVAGGCGSGVGLLFTSYLDHPFGQVFAAYCAAEMARAGVREMGLCGLASHPYFEPNGFSEMLELGEGGRLLVPVGAGLGFGEHLEKLPWVPL